MRRHTPGQKTPVWTLLLQLRSRLLAQLVPSIPILLKSLGHRQGGADYYDMSIASDNLCQTEVQTYLGLTATSQNPDPTFSGR